MVVMNPEQEEPPSISYHIMLCHRLPLRSGSMPHSVQGEKGIRTQKNQNKKEGTQQWEEVDVPLMQCMHASVH